jgi:hypothetical protein
MTPIVNQVKSAIKDMACGKHGEKPSITIQNDKITFTACCDDFAQEVNKKIDRKMNNLDLGNPFKGR